MDAFLVARNPDPASRLPFLVYLPIDGGLWLKAKESWPRGARVYCHRADGVCEIDLDVIERVPVASCQRRGAAIDLVLARGVNKRSQFVTTTFRGRPMILWQTPKTAAATRPGLRIPYGRRTTVETIVVDTRERYGYTFRSYEVRVVRRALPVGDYAVAIAGRTIAVERKTLENFATSLSDGSLNYAMAELATLASAAVVVEGRYADLLRMPHVPAAYLADLAARLAVRYPTVPIVFAESRKLGQEWTYRFFNAALAHHAGDELSSGVHE